MIQLWISLFGSFAVRSGEEAAIVFSYDKVRALLAYLTVESVHPSRRDRLAGLLWPDLPEARGASNLRTALYDLRTALHDRQAQPPFLNITHSTLQLNRDAPIWADVLAFKDQVAAIEAATALDSKDPEYEERLTGAAQLYTGAFLHGLAVDSGPFEDWVLLQREALQLQALDVLERLVVLYQQRRDHEQVLVWARRQVELEPWREGSHRHIMRALAALGRRAEAVAQYERCCSVLWEKLGLEPEDETRALLARIRAGRSADLTEADPRVTGDLAGRPPQAGSLLSVLAPSNAATEGAGAHSADLQQPIDSETYGGGIPGRVATAPRTLHGVERAVRDAEELRRQSGSDGQRAAMAAAQAALDVARAAGGSGAEALGHLYAGVVLANTTGAGFRESLAHLGQALALAQREHMPDMTSEILHYLGVDLLDEDAADVEGPLLQALALYRDLEHRVGESRMLGVLAYACLESGDLPGARRYGEEGVALARELGDRQEEGGFCRTLGTVALIEGQYGESMRRLQAGMTCFREVEEPAGEAAILRLMGLLFDQLGAYQRAEQVLARSMSTLPEGAGPVGILEAHVYLALVSLHAGDDAAADAAVEQALSLLAALGDEARRSGYPWLRAAALIVRAHALARQGRHNTAAVAYREALGVRQTGRWPGLSAEARAGLAALALIDEGPHAALVQVEGIVPELVAGKLTGAMDPLRVYLICYRVLEAAQDPRSLQVLEQARRDLLARADSIEDQGLRRTYLGEVAVNREIAATAP